MTLDLTIVGGRLRAMGDHLQSSQAERWELLQQARAYFARCAADWERLADEARRSPGSSAVPLEALDFTRDRPPTPSAYEVLATDGSTIEPDRHGAAMCAVINVGRVSIRYGGEPMARLESTPRLLYQPDELYLKQGDRRVLLTGALLDARRSVEEMEVLGELGRESGAGGVPQVALADGLLTIWRQDWAAADAEQVTDQFTAALDAFAARKLPLAAYVSNPHSHWAVDLLRHHARCDAVRGSACTLKCANQEACALDGLVDVDLFAHLLPGQRSCRFEVAGRDADRYGPENRSHFLYLNVGREIVRLEVPGWVAHDPEALDLIHAVVCDQADRGQGYPVALARAHEQAVITGADRRAFRQLVVEALVRAGLPSSASEKQISKSMRAV